MENYSEVRYEGYGRCIAVIVETTSTMNRTVVVRHALKHGGNLRLFGSVTFSLRKSA